MTKGLKRAFGPIVAGAAMFALAPIAAAQTGDTARFSWFDYRSRGFEDEPKRGLRIDLIMTSSGLQPRIKAAGVDYDLRGVEKPSDHAPIWLELH